MRRIERYEDEQIVLEKLVASEARGRPVLKVLEAGCGREWYLRPEGVRLQITGIDLDRAALEHRRQVQRDLDEAIYGDLRTAELPAAAYDVIYSSFVLEHVDGAQKALDNMVGWLRPGGLLIVRVPDLDGVQTFLARLLPRWVAVAYYRHAWKIRDAGKPGFAPYPTSYDPVISAAGFHEYCSRRGLALQEVIGVGTYASRGEGALSRVVPVIARTISLLTGGRVHDRHVDLTFIARKPALAGQPAAGAEFALGETGRARHAG